MTDEKARHDLTDANQKKFNLMGYAAPVSRLTQVEIRRDNLKITARARKMTWRDFDVVAIDAGIDGAGFQRGREAID
jgi:hypothetical protein